jgi:hypothetical protein
MRQHRERLTGTDQVLQDRAAAFSDPPPTTEHLLGIDVTEVD